jgi:putative membrane protein
MNHRRITSVADLTVRPTTKLLKAGAASAGLAFLALEIWCVASLNAAAGSPLIMIAPVLLLVWPAERAFKRRFSKLVITGDRLRYESGVVSRSTRNLQLNKVQDIRVSQRLMQRMLGIGDLSIETAGADRQGDFTIPNVDEPQALADEIMNRAQKGTATA